MNLNKIWFLLLLLCLVLPVIPQEVQPDDQTLEDEFINFRAENGESHASGAREDLGPVILGNPTQAVVAIRVGIYANTFTSTGGLSTEFSNLNHQFVQLSNSEGLVSVIDRATGQEIAQMEPGQIFDVRFDGTNYIVTGPEATVAVAGPVLFMPTVETNLFRIESILRTNILGGPAVKPQYRGAIEISRGTTTTAGRVNLVNILEVEKYVRGVVANESIASFHIDALKAQAVAARGYAIANVGRYVRLGYPFDIVDSSSSQVYRGYLSEVSRAVQATEETQGLVASFEGKIISAMYSSSVGGYTDNVEWIFNSPSTKLPGLNVTPYLTSIYDGEGSAPDLTDLPTLQGFWANYLSTVYDMCGRVNNRFSRWRIDIPVTTIKSRLVAPGRSVVISGNTSGIVTGVEAIQRMPGSNRIANVRVTLTSGVVEVRGWDNLRNVFGRSVVSTPIPFPCPSTAPIAANFTLTNPSFLEPYYWGDGSFRGVFAYGGGWGHNVGMSQYGAQGRALAGQNFLQILKAYYTGVDIGSYPIDIGREPGTGPPTLYQEFYAPNAIGTLVIRPTGGLKALNVHVNDTLDLHLTAEELAAPIISIDISPYLVAGLNTVQYNPVGRNGGATVNVNVE